MSEGGAEEIVRDLEFKDMKDRLGFARKLIEIFEADARALITAQEGERRSNGVDYKAQAESKQVDEVEQRERKALIASLVSLSRTYHERTKPKEMKSA